MPRIPRVLPKCYWILCYYPPPDWRTKFEIRQVDPAKLSPEVAEVITKTLGKMPKIGALDAGRQMR